MAQNNQNLNTEESRIKREIAKTHGYIAERGPHAGDGSAFQLDLAIISGEVATVLLGDEERRAVINWIADHIDQIEHDNWIAATGLRDIRDCLIAARERERDEL